MKPEPTNLDYLRAHQYLYYVVCVTVVSDYEYDVFGRCSGEDYKGGSDRSSDYSAAQTVLAGDMLARRAPPFPAGYSQ